MDIHVVINLRAAKFVARPQLATDVAQACMDVAHVHTSSTIDDLHRACANVARSRASLVVLCGGDGSYLAGLTCLRQAFGKRPLPALALASGGSSCTVARNWSRLLPEPAEHVRAVIERWSKLGPRSQQLRPTLAVRQDGQEEKTGFIFGAGLVSSFFKAFYASGGGGYGHASQMIARVFAGSFVRGPLAQKVLSPVGCTLTIDGTTHPNPAFTLIVSAVVRDLGLGLRVTHRAGEDLQRPHLVASSLSAPACGKQFGRVLTGRPLIGPRHVDLLASSFSLGFRDPTSGYVLDGDLFTASEVTVGAGPTISVVSV